MQLAQALRSLSESNAKLNLLYEQFRDEQIFEMDAQKYLEAGVEAVITGPSRPAKNLQEIKKVQYKIGQLKLRLQLTNVNTHVTYDGQNCTLAELLILLQNLKQQCSLVKQLCSRRGTSHRMMPYQRGDGETMKVLPDYDVDKMRKERDRLTQEISKLDLFIQQTNFDTQLIE